MQFFNIYFKNLSFVFAALHSQSNIKFKMQGQNVRAQGRMPGQNARAEWNATIWLHFPSVTVGAHYKIQHHIKSREPKGPNKVTLISLINEC